MDLEVNKGFRITNRKQNRQKAMQINETILSKDSIQQRVEELGRQITEDYKGKQLVLIGIFNGAFIFIADLARAIELDIEIDFIRVSSYGDGKLTSGSIKLTKEPEIDLKGKEVLLVEDIVDTGTTMEWLQEYLQGFEPASVRICSLIDKHERRQVEVQVDYAGFKLDKGFLIGYGLDYAERYRNLPEVYSMGE